MSSRIVATPASGSAGVVSGTYTGDGNATQAVATVGFQPRFILILPVTNNIGSFAKNNQDGLNATSQDNGFGGQYMADLIISLDALGFTVGDAHVNSLNTLARVYHYLCWK